MSEETKQPTTSLAPELPPEVVSGFSVQPTGMVETTYAETLGLSMHNAILSQQNSQMVTQASVTNACARLLTIPSLIQGKEEVSKEEDEAVPGADVSAAEPLPEGDKQQKQPKKLNIGNFFKRNKNTDDENSQKDKGNTKASGDLDKDQQDTNRGVKGDGDES